MTKIHMLRVFVDEKGAFGDSSLVVIDEGKKISDANRQKLAIKIGAAETVCIKT